MGLFGFLKRKRKVTPKRKKEVRVNTPELNEHNPEIRRKLTGDISKRLDIIYSLIVFHDQRTMNLLTKMLPKRMIKKIQYAELIEKDLREGLGIKEIIKKYEGQISRATCYRLKSQISEINSQSSEI